MNHYAFNSLALATAVTVAGCSAGESRPAPDTTPSPVVSASPWSTPALTPDFTPSTGAEQTSANDNDVKCNDEQLSAEVVAAIKASKGVDRSFAHQKNELEFPAVSAAAIAGTIYFESQADPTYVSPEGYGKGLLALSPTNWQRVTVFAEKRQEKPQNLEVQLDYLAQDLATNPLFAELHQKLQEPDGLGQATSDFTNIHQRPFNGMHCFRLGMADVVLRDQKQ